MIRTGNQEKCKGIFDSILLRRYAVKTHELIYIKKEMNCF